MPLLRTLRALFAPPRGRRRAATPLPPPAQHTDRPSSRRRRALDLPIDGDSTRLIRPYLVAHEQGVRRQELALALLGLDGPGPYVIHGAEVS
ncbi:hypothetical protein [Streptomyces sp. ODS28]|uniref:hypothetical protein n=1 Tax=Streptomyces sp. ODS28 TaxID=3136688 RepID=UPI0031E9CB75